MTVSIPESVAAEGNVKAVFVAVIAAPGAPTAAELAAGVNISNTLMPDWDGPTATQNTGEDRRFSSRQTFMRLGRVQWEVSPLVYTYDPQTAAGAANTVADALTEGNSGYLVMGYGIDANATLVATDVVDVVPVKCGVQVKAARGADEFAPLTITQTLAVTNTVRQDVAVAA